MLLYCDGYLKLCEESQDERKMKAIRFFKLSKELPLELNMILARKICLGTECFFLSHQVEDAIKRVLSLFLE